VALVCPNCGCKHCPTTNTYTRKIIFRGREKTFVRRRKICRHCGTAFYSQERLEEELLEEQTNPQAYPENPYL